MTTSLLKKLEYIHQELVSFEMHGLAVSLQNVIDEVKQQKPVGYIVLTQPEGELEMTEMRMNFYPAAIQEGRVNVRDQLFTHPPLSDEIVKDAERYAWLREKSISHKHSSPTATLADGYGIKVRYGLHGDPKCQPFITLTNEILDNAIDEAMKAYK